MTDSSKSLRFTPRANRVMRWANEEAQKLNGEYVGTEHILLGLLREHEGAAYAVLSKAGVTIEDVLENSAWPIPAH